MSSEPASENSVRHFAQNGKFYCGKMLDLCECGNCTIVCGGDNDTGCQCTFCKNAQKQYVQSIDTKCPNDHPLRLKLISDLSSKYLNTVYCSVCRHDITHAHYAPTQFLLICDACLYFVCPRCIPRVAPVASYPCLGTVANADTIPPIEGVQKWVRPAGSIYCGRQMGQCKCGCCDGRCGPDNGCACDECEGDLRRLLTEAQPRCSKCRQLYAVVAANSVKGGLFRHPTCSVCSHALKAEGWEGFQLALSCSCCGDVVCPACAKRKIPLANLPANIYFFYNGPPPPANRQRDNAMDFPCV